MKARSPRLLKDILWILALGGLVGGLFRLWFGLGATTGLSDAVPWGLWKVLNMIAGVALSTSGFTVGLLVYVLRRERFKPLLKPAILLAFLGYGSSCLALLFDIGLPHRFWHPFVMWNHHSFLFEVFWCVMLYFTVTCLELLPSILERYRAEKVVRALHAVAFGVVVFGISLSSLHHSSLGSLFLVTPQRLHALWYSPMLPVFFILSAIGGGLMMLVLVRILHARWYDPEPVFGPAPEGDGTVCLLDTGAAPTPRAPEGPELPALRRLADIGACVLGVYFVLKVTELLRSGDWRALGAGNWESWLFVAELAVGILLPVILLVTPSARRSPRALGVAAFCGVSGLVLNRLDVGIFGYWRDAAVPYVPSLTEWAVSLGVVAAACLAFMAIAENFSIFEDGWRRLKQGPQMYRASFDAFTHVLDAVLTNGLQRVSLIAVIALPLAWVTLYPAFHEPSHTEMDVAPPVGLDLQRATLRMDGTGAGLPVDFPHAAHQQRLGGEGSCGTCHHVSLPGDQSTPCHRCHRNMIAPTDIFDHHAHTAYVAAKEQLGGLRPANRSCAVCHDADATKTAGSSKTCLDCHREDLWRDVPPAPGVDPKLATSYQGAMHGLCIDCHAEEAARTADAGLAECGACHADLRMREPADARVASR